MATGVLPFQGQTTAAVFDSLIHSVPEWPVQFDPATPPELERIVRKALEKDPAQRYASAADMRTDLQNLRRETESGQALATGSAARPAPDSKERIRSAFAMAATAPARAPLLPRRKAVNLGSFHHCWGHCDPGCGSVRPIAGIPSQGCCVGSNYE